MEKSIKERAWESAIRRMQGSTEYAIGYQDGATEQKELDDKRIAELEKEKAALMLEINNKNKRIAELIAR